VRRTVSVLLALGLGFAVAAPAAAVGPAPDAACDRYDRCQRRPT